MIKRFLRAMLNNPVVRYYRNLLANYSVERRGRGISIDSSATIWDSVVADYVKIGARAILFRARIGAFSYVAEDARLNLVSVGRFCSIGPHVKTGYGQHPSDRVSTHPIFYSNRGQCGLTFHAQSRFEELSETIIGNDVWIGTAAILMDGITINDGAIVAAGAVVTSDVPPYAIVGGIPAEIIRFRASAGEIDAVRKLEWWNWPEEKLRANLAIFDGPIAGLLEFGRKQDRCSRGVIEEDVSCKLP